MRRRVLNTMTIPWAGAPIASGDASLSQNLVYDSKNSLTPLPHRPTALPPPVPARSFSSPRRSEEFVPLPLGGARIRAKDNDWFRISAANPEGTRWEGTCWYVFPLQFDVPVAYHQVAPEIELPTLDGKTHKTYRGGKICLTVHFKPLWAKNCPRFGLAAEVPILVDSGMVKHKDDEAPLQTPSLRLALLLLLSCLCYHVQMNRVGFRVVQLYIHCNGNGKPLFVQMKFSEVYTYYSSRRLHTPCKPCLSMTYDTEAQ